MRTGLGAALLACADAGSASGLAAALAECGCAPIVTASDMASALSALSRSRFDLALIGAVLPGGDGMALARRIITMPLLRYPDVLFLPNGGMWTPEADQLADCGASLLSEPVTSQSLAAAVEALRGRGCELPTGKAARLGELLDRLGIPAHAGRHALFRAVALTWRDKGRVENIRANIYPGAGGPSRLTVDQTERAIRHVIERAWRDGDIDEQQRIFGDTIDAGRGRPTCGELIARLADVLRWEG